MAPPPPASSEHRQGMSRSAAPAETKRGRRQDVDDSQPAASPSSAALRVRMDKELLALQALVKRAKLILPGSAAEKKCAPPPVVSSPPAAKRSASPSKPATEAKQQRPAEAPAAAKQQRPVVQQRAADKKRTEAPMKKRPRVEEERLARAAAREEFRRMLQEMEKAALPDETIYPEDLQELGIAFEHVVTRTKKEAWLGDRRMPAAARLHGGVGTMTSVVGIAV